jgi:hypothetical protein
MTLDGPAADGLLPPWPDSAVSPVCTVRVAAPAWAVLPLVADLLRQAGLHVRQDAHGVLARSRSRRVLNAVGITIGMLVGADGTLARNSPFRVLVLSGSASGCVLEIGTARGDGADTAVRVDGPAAVDRALRMLRDRGVAVQVGPWEHRGLRGRRSPIAPPG